MNLRIFKHISVCFIIVLVISCKTDNTNKVEPDYGKFTVMNIFQSEGFSFPFYYPLTDINGTKCRLDSILKKSKLIFRFSELNCELCIRSEIDLMNKLNLSNHVIGFASYSNIRMLKLAQKKYNIQFPIYFLSLGSNGALPEDKESLGRPYLFLMNTDFRAKYLFFPSIQHPIVSEVYYKEILYLLDHNNSNEDFFDEKMIDLGTISKGKTYKAKFKYTNKTPDLLIIENINTSCGCTVPRWDKKPLKEEESSELVISFTPETLGYNSKFIMVSFNKYKHPVRLIIKANVE